MATYPLFKDLTSIFVPLGDIYLDPNNPRFVGPNWINVPDEETDSEPVQEKTRFKLVQEHGVEKLRLSMEVNGYLPIDRIIVREFKPSKYVLLEGNRRICAAKMVGPLGIDGATIPVEILDSFNTIPCLQYTGTEQDASWIFQGLRHITGISEWSAYNKARSLVEQMEEEKTSLTDAGKRFGLTAFGAGQWVRGYFAFQQGRSESDYVQEVDERSYPYFQEVFSKSSAQFREWLEWDESKGKGQYRFKNLQRLNEFVGWLYPRPTSDTGEEAADSRGDWEKRYLKQAAEKWLRTEFGPSSYYL